MNVRVTIRLLIAALAVSTVVACSDDEEARTVTVVTHDSFAVTEGVLDAFTEATGIAVRVKKTGDAGAALNQALLAKGNPEGDVFFGVDNTFLTRALDEDVFVAYESAALESVDPRYVVDDEHRVTPVDYGDVCLNYDKAFFEAPGAPPVPATLADLARPEYRDRLVVENPATSSPGLVFLAATVEQFGDGWVDYWEALRANGVSVADGWEDAYYGQFSGGSGSEGDRPLVVSYASSPPAEVVFADPPVDVAPTGVIDASCARQVEFAGILRGTDHEDEAHEFIDFLLSKDFQEDMPLNMFVFPVRTDAALPDAFVAHAAAPENPYELEPDDVGAHRDEWIETWTTTVLR
jgi:thiamine transport system substrate-binding protein